MTKKQFDRWVESHYYDCTKSTGIGNNVIETIKYDIRHNNNFTSITNKGFTISVTGKKSKTLRITNAKTGKTGYSSVDTTTETFDIFIGIAIAWARYCSEEIPTEIEEDVEPHYLTIDDFRNMKYGTKIRVIGEDGKPSFQYTFVAVHPVWENVIIFVKGYGITDDMNIDDQKIILDEPVEDKKEEVKKEEVKSEPEKEPEVKYITWIDFMNMTKGTCFTTAFEGNKEVYKFLYIKDVVQRRFCASDSMSRKVTFTFAENQYVPYKVTTRKNTEFEPLYYTLEDFNRMKRGTIIRSAETHKDYTFAMMFGLRAFFATDNHGTPYIIPFKPNTYF